MEKDRTVNINSPFPLGLLGWLNMLMGAVLPWLRKAGKLRLWMCLT